MVDFGTRVGAVGYGAVESITSILSLAVEYTILSFDALGGKYLSHMFKHQLSS